MKSLKLYLIFCMGLLLASSCGNDDEVPMPPTNAPVASFQYEIDATDFLQVSFTNFSQNATSYAWDFGDGNTSTDENPVHTYSGAGTYTVNLTASGEGDPSTFSETITITDPNEAVKLLTGETSKTWKLFREGTSMSLGPDADSPDAWWSGLTNDGARPCSYEQEFTFHLDGTYEFNDNGMFWAEFGVFNNTGNCTDNTVAESCFDATPANMVNECGDDVSAWLSGTHAFTYDPSAGELTLTGQGAWIGIPKLGTTGESITPQASVMANISIEQFTGYDVMTIVFDYGTAYWPIRYASYSDPSLEPDLVTDTPVFGEDLDDISPTELSSAFDGTFVLLDTIASGSTIDYNVDDPADASAPKVGQFNRTTATFQELQFQTSPTKNDINFENLTTVSIDVYLPSSNDYSGTLTKNVIIGLADRSQTEQWWTDHQQYEMDGMSLPEDEWVTISFNLSDPTFVGNADNGLTPYDRNDYDMIFLNIGSGGHEMPGTFYVRNLKFE